MNQEENYSLKWRLIRFWSRLVWLFTGECNFHCEIAKIRDVSGYVVQQFIPEAGCPVHDI